MASKDTAPVVRASAAAIAGIAAATVAAALIGLGLGLAVVLFLSSGESGGLGLPVALSGFIGGGVAGAVGGAPVALWRRSSRTVLVAAASAGAVGLLAMSLFA